MKVKGFDELKKKLNRMSENAKSIEGEHSVPLIDLFNNAFVIEHTSLNTSEEFFEKLQSELGQDFANSSEAERDSFVKSISNFDSWKEILTKAVGSYTLRKIME